MNEYAFNLTLHPVDKAIPEQRRVYLWGETPEQAFASLRGWLGMRTDRVEISGPVISPRNPPQETEAERKRRIALTYALYDPIWPKR